MDDTSQPIRAHAQHRNHILPLSLLLASLLASCGGGGSGGGGGLLRVPLRRPPRLPRLRHLALQKPATH